MARKISLEDMEYSTDTLMRGAFVTDDATNLQCYSEATIKTQGDYALKGIATTDSVGKRLRKTFSTSFDLSSVKNLEFDIRSNRTGSNIKFILKKVVGAGYATGGTITYDGDYTVHTFTSSGTFEAIGDIEADVLVVGGGGGGGGGASSGGGGAGGMAEATGFSIPNNTYTVTVGNGGAGGGAFGNGTNGQDSVFSSITAKGGGAGNSDRAGIVVGNAGGCGGGGANTGTPIRVGGASTQTSGTGWTGYGYAGGNAPVSGSPYPGGGGGGAGGAGQTPSANGAGGNGGIGRQNSITGTAIYYAGGGGGAERVGSKGQGTGGLGGGGNAVLNGTGGAGTNGLGGGGGAVGDGNGDTGGAGGSGVVIIRYMTPSVVEVANIIPNIVVADTFQKINFDISAIADADKDTISVLDIEIVNDDAENTFYVDNFIVSQAIDVVGLIG